MERHEREQVGRQGFVIFFPPVMCRQQLDTLVVLNYILFVCKTASSTHT